MKHQFPHAHLALVLALSGCASASPEIRVRGAAPSQLSAAQSAIEQAQSLQARGEYALAIDTYRKVIRFEPANAEAYAGLAACYDKIGRGDLADRYFQMALAHDPRNPALTARYANVLARQGRDADAVRLLTDVAEPSELPSGGTRAQAAQIIQPVRTETTQISAPAPTEVEGRTATESQHMRLERLSMAEVALVSRSSPVPRRDRLVRVTLEDPVDTSQMRVAGVRIVNAVGRRGQAARMRAHLEGDGWRAMSIGDSAQRLSQSRLIVPAGLTREGYALASRLPFRTPVVRSARARAIVLMLGANAVRFDDQLKARTS